MKNRRISSRVTLAALLALALTLSVTGGTLAWLVSRTEPIVNTFTLGTLTVRIEEDFEEDDDIKENVKIQNPNDDDKHVPAYVRVALIPTWVNDSKKPVGESASLSDLDISFNLVDWFVGDDGYYYYRHILSPGEYTTNLIHTATVVTANGYRMNLQVIADGIQAQPDTAVKSVWPVNVTANGELVKKGATS